MQLPNYIPVLFACTTLVSLLLFVQLFNSSKTLVSLLLCIWLVVQAFLGYKNVYSSNTNVLPPRIFVFGVLPTIILVIFTLVTKKGNHFINNLSLKQLTIIHVVRIPVEIVLYLLFINKTIPKLMTFEGRNFDIIAGITAPIMAYLAFRNSKVSKKLLIFWNVIGLILLLNIVFNALFSAPSPIQKFAFDQPNIAILYFPFCWLPTFIVPIVLFSHLAALSKLLRK